MERPTPERIRPVMAAGQISPWRPCSPRPLRRKSPLMPTMPTTLRKVDQTWTRALDRAGHYKESAPDRGADHDVAQLPESKDPAQRGALGYVGHRGRLRRSSRTVSSAIRFRSTVTPMPGWLRGTAISPSLLMVHSGLTMSSAQ